jgi:hypothetical protein
LVLRTDAIGANVIHAAYLFQNYPMARWLVENYAEEALAPFCSDTARHSSKYGVQIEPHEMPYTGESILHIVVIHKAHAEARWLLEFYRQHCYSVPDGLSALLHANAIGTFFARDGGFYCGGYPIHFAAASNRSCTI